MTEPTPQELGREWEREGARLTGARLQKGSGNQYHARGDMKNGGQIVWSFKHTVHNSFSVSRAIVDDARTMALGPSVAAADIVDILAIKTGDGTMRADLDLMQLIAWISEPPQIIKATAQDSLRRTARTPTFLRE